MKHHQLVYTNFVFFDLDPEDRTAEGECVFSYPAPLNSAPAVLIQSQTFIYLRYTVKHFQEHVG